jgi:hypothetical protein
MLNLLFRFLGLWGMIDALWMTQNRRAWSDFWQGRVVAIGESQDLSRTMALLQFSFSLWLLTRPR